MIYTIYGKYVADKYAWFVVYSVHVVVVAFAIFIRYEFNC